MGKALTYAVNQWPSLERFLDDGRILIDSNAVEREIRPVVVGRKNWLFAGSDEGRRRAAVVYSLIGSCVLAGVEPEAWLADVLAKIGAGWPNRRIGEPLPENWLAARSSAEPAAAGESSSGDADCGEPAVNEGSPAVVAAVAPAVALD